MKKQYDQRAEAYQFCPGDRVLAHLPIVDSPFRPKYSGPFFGGTSGLRFKLLPLQAVKELQSCVMLTF